MSNTRKPKVRKVTVIKADDSWFKKQITAGNLISVATMAFGFAGFYFNTSSSLQVQAKAISAIESKMADGDRRDEKQQREVVGERTQLRSEMTSRAEKTAEGIAELSKQTAVLSTQLTSIREELVKVTTQLTQIAATNKRP
jgi:hypothetical protein